jgi:5-methylcytosine-specific restriction endonuclease McrA
MSKESSTKRGYNHRWQRFRLFFLKENPLCVFCKEEGKVEPATVVDHIEPHRGDMTMFWDKGNMQPLCHNHHASTKQAMERRNINKPAIGDDGWPK